MLGLGACSEKVADPSGGGAGAEPPAAGGGSAAGGGGHGGGVELPVGQCSPPVEAQPFDKGLLPLYLSSIAFDRSGNLGMTGIAQTRIDLGGGELTPGGGMDVVVAKFDAAGNHGFSTLFGSGSDQRGASIAFDSGCNMILGGSFAGAMDLGGATLTGGKSLFVAKLDAAGNHVWSKRLGGASALDPLYLSVAVDPTTDDVEHIHDTLDYQSWDTAWALGVKNQSATADAAFHITSNDISGLSFPQLGAFMATKSRLPYAASFHGFDEDNLACNRYELKIGGDIEPDFRRDVGEITK